MCLALAPAMIVKIIPILNSESYTLHKLSKHNTMLVFNIGTPIKKAFIIFITTVATTLSCAIIIRGDARAVYTVMKPQL